MISTYLVSHTLAVATVVASLFTVLRLVESRRTPQSMLAWLVAIAFLPFVAMPLYLLLGSRKFPRRAKTAPRAGDAARAAVADDVADASAARVLRQSGVAPPRAGNTFELLSTGEAAYARLMELIAGAERSIDLTVFILGSDATGRAVVEALAERARGGVSVRVIVDAVGSRPAHRHAARTLEPAGGELRVFMPLRHSPLRGRTNLRSHRKLAVFDGEHVFAGGMNLADEYMGPPRATGNAPRFRDVAAVTRGPVAIDAEALFESDWGFCGGSKRARAVDIPAPVFAGGDATVQIVPSGPDMSTDTVYDLFLTAIFGAKTRIAIVTPYYVPDDLLQHALVLSARRGVRTELVIPARSNHYLADAGRPALLRELSSAGAVVHYYPHGMVHAKAMVVDESFAYVGSPNFDMRSLFLNYEDALAVYSEGAIAQIRAFIDGLIAESTTEEPPHRESRVMAQIARLLAPEL